LKRPTKEEEEEEEEEMEMEGVEEVGKMVVGEAGRVEVVRQEERVEERVEDIKRSMDNNIDPRNNLKKPAKVPVSHQNLNSVTATSDTSASKAVSAAQVTRTHTTTNNNNNNNNNANTTTNTNNNTTNTNTNNNINSNTRKQDVHDRVRYEAKMRYSASNIKNRIPLKIAESADPSSFKAHHNHHVVVAERVTATASALPSSSSSHPSSSSSHSSSTSSSSSSSSSSSVLKKVTENVQDSRTASQPPRSVTVRAPSVRYTAPTPAPSTVLNQLCEVSADGAREDGRDDRDGRDGRGERSRVPVEHPLSLLSSLQSNSLLGHTHQPPAPATVAAVVAAVAVAVTTAPAVLPATVTTSAVASVATTASVATAPVTATATDSVVVTAGVTKGVRGRKRTAEALKPAPSAVPTVSKSKKFWNSPAPTQSLTTAGPVNDALCVSGPEDKQPASWASLPLPLPVPLTTAQSSSHPHRSASLPVVSAYKVEETVPKMRREGKLHVSASSLKVAFDDEHEHVTDALQQPERRVSLRNRK
jgi:hypothetical protein